MEALDVHMHTNTFWLRIGFFIFFNSAVEALKASDCKKDFHKLSSDFRADLH